jgi:hypothetical protein
LLAIAVDNVGEAGQRCQLDVLQVSLNTKNNQLKCFRNCCEKTESRVP